MMLKGKSQKNTTTAQLITLWWKTDSRPVKVLFKQVLKAAPVKHHRCIWHPCSHEAGRVGIEHSHCNWPRA